MNDYTNPQTARIAERERKARVFAEFQEFAIELDKNLPPIPRTWGVEIEAPNMQLVSDQLATFSDVVNGKGGLRVDGYPLFFTEDGSVKREDGECECECDSCSHDCNCNECERQDNLYHECGNNECGGVGDYQEVSTIGGLDRLNHEAMNLIQEAGIENLEYNDTCGVHLNIGSSDLTPSEVARVLSAYRRIAPIVDAIAGRSDVYYAVANSELDIEEARQGRASHKYRAINTAHHFNGESTRTIRLEFRQVAGEQFKGNRQLIQAWAFILIQLVEFAKSDQPIFWLGCAKSVSQLMSELSRR